MKLIAGMFLAVIIVAVLAGGAALWLAVRTNPMEVERERTRQAELALRIQESKEDQRYFEMITAQFYALVELAKIDAGTQLMHRWIDFLTLIGIGLCFVAMMGMMTYVIVWLLKRQGYVSPATGKQLIFVWSPGHVMLVREQPKALDSAIEGQAIPVELTKKVESHGWGRG